MGDSTCPAGRTACPRGSHGSNHSLQEFEGSFGIGPGQLHPLPDGRAPTRRGVGRIRHAEAVREHVPRCEGDPQLVPFARGQRARQRSPEDAFHEGNSVVQALEDIASVSLLQ